MKDIDGTNVTFSTAFGNKGFATIEPGQGTMEEQISFTGITQNANGTATLTGVSNVSFLSPYTETSGLSKTHAGSTTLIISNTSGFYNELTSKDDDETIAGDWTFTNYAPTIPTQISSDIHRAASIEYVNAIAIAGAPDASTTVKGISKLSVAPVSPTNPIAAGTNDPRIPGAIPVIVAEGGTGRSTLTANAILAGGTTTTANAQSLGLGTTTTVLHGNAAGLATFGAVVLTTDVSGILPVANGGTGASTLTLASLANVPNTDTTPDVYYSWTVPLVISKQVSSSAYNLAGFTASIADGSVNSPTDDRGGSGVTNIGAASASSYFATLPGNGSNTYYTAASSKAIRMKFMAKWSAQGGGNFYGVGMVDAATTLDDVQTGTAIGMRFIVNNATLYTSCGDGTNNQNTDIHTLLTYTNWNVYEIVFTPGVNVIFYVNGVAVATYTTNLPTGSVSGFGFGFTNTGVSRFSPVTFSLQL